jgi:hypothetical protein
MTGWNLDELYEHYKKVIGHRRAYATIKNGQQFWGTHISPHVGQYKVRVSASDTGLPVRTVFREFTVDVEEPAERVVAPVKPLPPNFDTAQLAFFTSTVQINDYVEVWILRRDIDEMVKLTIGDRVDIGNIVGTIREISQKELLIVTDSDDTLLVKPGQSLASAENLTLAAERLLENTGP